MTTSHATQERSLPSAFRSADLPRMEPDPMRTSDSLTSFVDVVQRLADEARTLIGVHYGMIRVALDERGAQLISAVSASARHISASGAGKAEDAIGVDSLFFPLPRPLRMTQNEILAHPAWTVLATGMRYRPALRGFLAVPLFTTQRPQPPGSIVLTGSKARAISSANDETRLVQMAKIAALAAR